MFYSVQFVKAHLFLYLYSVQKQVKIYKPSQEEILRNVLGSFEIENIKFSASKAKEIFTRAVSIVKPVKR